MFKHNPYFSVLASTEETILTTPEFDAGDEPVCKCPLNTFTYIGVAVSVGVLLVGLCTCLSCLFCKGKCFGSRGWVSSDWGKFYLPFVDFFSQPQVKTHLGFHFLRNKCFQTTISKMTYGLFWNMSAANEQVGENPIIRCLKIWNTFQ